MTSKILASINPKIQLPHTLRYSPVGKTKLFAGLHKAQHGIACDTPIPAHGATGDFSLGDATAQIILGRIGVQWDFRAFKNLEQFFFAA